MTTTASGREKTSACNGVTILFACPDFMTAGDLKVYLLDSADEANSDGALLAEGGDYVVSGDGRAGSGQITTTIAYPAGKFIRRWRETSREQSVEFTANQGIPADTQEAALDRLSMVDEELDQGIADVGARALAVPLTETAAPLPAKADRAGKYAFWDADGKLIGIGALSAPDAAALALLGAPPGAALIGSASGNSVQFELSKIGAKDEGVLPAGEYTPFVTAKTATGNPSETSDWRTMVEKATFSGTHGAEQVCLVDQQLEVPFTTGHINFAFLNQGYLRFGVGGLGAGGSPSGSVSSCAALFYHISHCGSDHVGDMMVARFDGPDLDEGIGTVQNYYTVFSGDFGSNRILGRAVGIFQANCSASTTPLVSAIRSELSGGAGRWDLDLAGGANNRIVGRMRLGDGTAPNDQLEVKGFTKLVRDGTVAQVGGFHEISTDNNDYTVHVRNSHATLPSGVRVRFTGGAPNNTTQNFLLCEDNAATRLAIRSNGNVVNTNNSYGAISDRKLKTGIRDAGPQLADIRALQVRKYRLKADGDDGHEQIGLIAQEVEKVSPGLVFETPDMESHFEQEFERGGVGEPDIPLIGKGQWKERPSKTVTKGVAYSVLNVKLLRAVQELAGMVEAQAIAIAQLQKKQRRA